jgi:hypothetical protein
LNTIIAVACIVMSGLCCVLAWVSYRRGRLPSRTFQTVKRDEHPIGFFLGLGSHILMAILFAGVSLIMIFLAK